MIGFGSIGRGTLPLILRHFDVDPADIVVVAPDTGNDALLDQLGVRKVTAAVTADNYRDCCSRRCSRQRPRPAVLRQPLRRHLIGGDPVALPPTRRALRRHRDRTLARLLRRPGRAARSAHQLRTTPDPPGRAGGRTRLGRPRCRPAAPTPAWCPGSSSRRCSTSPSKVGLDHSEPTSRAEWAELMRASGVTGIHIAERDTQRSCRPKPIGTFVNTWSVDGFISEGLQPSEIGWGTHERWLPPSACHHADPGAPSIYLARPGADTRVRTWCPTAGAQYGLCVTHNESISIADYFTVRDGDTVNLPARRATMPTIPPTTPYCPGTSCWARGGKHRSGITCWMKQRSSTASTSSASFCTGTRPNAYWFGSRLSIEETRSLAPYQNATGLQVTSAVLAAMVWATGAPRCRHRRSRRHRLSALPRSPAALPRPGRRALHRLDAALDPVAAVPRRHRRDRPVAIPQRPGPLTRRTPRRAGRSTVVR